MSASITSQIEDRDFFRRLCPRVSASDSVSCSARPDYEFRQQRAQLLAEGYSTLPDFLVPSATHPLAMCVENLVSAGLPPIFALVYDEFWSVFQDVAVAVGRGLGRDYRVLADSWAWHVPPDKGNRGWPMHRDYRGRVVRDEEGLPTRLNAWVALTRAPVDHACMSLVPFPLDPHYPGDLQRLDGIGSGRPVPAEAGTVLLWDANMLHWGGEANPHAPLPRISIAITLELHGLGGQVVDFGKPFTFHDRLEVIARQVTEYQRREPHLPPELLQWALMITGLSEIRSRR